MEVTLRELVTIIHGMLFGGFFLMAIGGAIVLLLEWSSPNPEASPSRPAARWRTTYLVAMVALGWAAVLSGAYVVYPWYRAVAPPGADLVAFPQRLLMSNPTTAGWHTLGMEWKEHVAWFAPMVATMVSFVMLRHRAAWSADGRLRRVVLGFAAVAFLAAAIAGGWGAMIDKAAPVRGGDTIQLWRSAP